MDSMSSHSVVKRYGFSQLHIIYQDYSEIYMQTHSAYLHLKHALKSILSNTENLENNAHIRKNIPLTSKDWLLSKSRDIRTWMRSSRWAANTLPEKNLRSSTSVNAPSLFKSPKKKIIPCACSERVSSSFMSSNYKEKEEGLVHQTVRAVGQSVSLACGRLGVWIPAATDLSRKNR